MAGRAGKAGKNAKADPQAVSKEFFEALAMFEEERGIPSEYMIAKISEAITNAIKRNNRENDDVTVIIDPEEGKFEVYLNKVVVEEVNDECRQLTLEQARAINPHAAIGDKVGVKQDPREVGRIAASTAKQTLRQGIHDHEKNQVAEEMRSHQQEIVSAKVYRVDERSGTLILKIGKADVPLLRSEQIEGESYAEGDIVKVYVVEIKGDEKGSRATISRTHPDFVKRLFENEVPEISDGIVEIKAVSREAGSRTKMAVASVDPDVDAVGACIGHHRSRVNRIVEELGGEKIDIIKYSEDPVEFIRNALAPANVLSVEIDEENPKACRVRVPDGQLSLAIGHKGQNARLAARLTGFKIDIRPESGYYGEEMPKPKADDADAETVEEITAEDVAETAEETAAAEDVAEAAEETVAADDAAEAAEESAEEDASEAAEEITSEAEETEEDSIPEE